MKKITMLVLLLIVASCIHEPSEDAPNEIVQYDNALKPLAECSALKIKKEKKSCSSIHKSYELFETQGTALFQCSGTINTAYGSPIGTQVLYVIEMTSLSEFETRVIYKGLPTLQGAEVHYQKAKQIIEACSKDIASIKSG